MLQKKVTFQINYLQESPGCRGAKQVWPNSVPTVARGDFKKEEMLKLSLGGVGIKPGEGKQKRKRTFWEETAV